MFRSELNMVRTRKNKTAWEENRNKTNLTPLYTMYNKEYFRTEYEPKPYVPLGFEKIRTANPEMIKQKPKKKCKIPLEAIKKYTEDYCAGTSLHGLKYIGATDVSLFERFFWILSFITAMGFSAYFISNIYDKWNFTPVIVGINPKFKTIQSIPFPAITMCNMNQVRKSVAMEIIKNQDEEDLMLLDSFCNTYNTTFPENNTDDMSTNWETVKKFMVKANQPCEQMIVNCQWEGVHYPCSDLVNPALTDEGVCCTFNRVPGKYMYHDPWSLGDFNITYPYHTIDWTPEVGYPDNIPKDVWPFRPAGAGSHLGLTLVANINTKDYYCSSTNSIGLKVRLHSPVESPMIADFGFFMHPRKENRVAIYPTVDEALSIIYSIPIEKRQCVFSNERALFFFRTYTKNNCEMECISNYTLHECSCVPYYLPKNVNTKICGRKKEQCYKNARAKMETSRIPKEVCNCLPACYEISFNQDVSIGDISNPYIRKPYTNSTETADLIVMHFYFSNMQFRSYQKSELFGFTEFLSNTGGLLGLFLGFSFLSAVEIGYHLTLKIWCAYYKNVKEQNGVIRPFAK